MHKHKYHRGPCQAKLPTHGEEMSTSRRIVTNRVAGFLESLANGNPEKPRDSRHALKKQQFLSETLFSRIERRLITNFAAWLVVGARPKFLSCPAYHLAGFFQACAESGSPVTSALDL